jgi:hypothetical protein
LALEWIIGAMRRAVALLTLCAFMIAPVIIAATHGPGLPMDSVQATEHLLHGHSHDEPEPGQFGDGHDATDHEHQNQMVLPHTGGIVFAPGGLRLGMFNVLATGLPSSGLRRPPKDMSA